MDNDLGLGLGMLIGGVLLGGMTTLIAILAAKRWGRILWGQPISVISLVFFWVVSLTVTVVGVYFLAKPHGPGHHARVGLELRERQG